ncbi:MAG: apolipoprotein N-acyltransferase [Actinomycetaceae bacterium]|nr:apolipoprotein N-acyltransferase [Actinomycetaceae bacterium]
MFFFLLFDWATQAAGIVLARVALAGMEAFFYGLLGILWAGLSHMERQPSRRKPRSRKRDQSASAPTKLSELGKWLGLHAFPVSLFGGAGAWILMEQLRATLPFGGMPWGNLAFAFTSAPLSPLARYGSTALVGFAAVVTGLLITRAFNVFRRQPGRAAIAVSLSVLLLGAPAIIPVGVRPDERIRVAIVQGNVPDVASLPEGVSRALTVTENHAEATYPILNEYPDLILWPESASDRDIRADTEAMGIVEDVVAQAGVPLVMGTQEYLDEGRFNDYLVVLPDGSISATYSKQHPVPFGEYIPMRDTFRFFTAAVDQVHTDMLAGTNPAYIPVQTDQSIIGLATPICFEVAYDSIVADGVSQGAQLIVVPTNNASFGMTGEAYQQFEMTRFRAIEHGRTAIQVSTSGTSGVVDANGVVRYQTELFTPDARVMEVALHSKLTFATTTHEIRTVVVYMLGAISVLVSFLGFGIRYRERSRMKATSSSRKKTRR